MAKDLYLINAGSVKKVRTALSNSKDTSVSDIVLLNDAAYDLLTAKQHWITLCQHYTVYALYSELSARGLAEKSIEELQRIGYNELVKLTESANKIISWP